ncbi:MAG: dihydroorotase [Turneriella sp.]|nr:dihydroorotase [Turneriella sp.]
MPAAEGALLRLRRGDDMHLHLRDGHEMADVLPFSARQFARAIVMPNLKPPVVAVRDAHDYRMRILNALPKGLSFEPLMTLYLTDNTTKDVVREAKSCGFIHGIKFYPAGATTNSESGVSELKKLYPLIEEMQKQDMPLLVHGEVTDKTVDIFDREKFFIERELIPLTRTFPGLRIVFEHITTKEAADFVLSASARVAATITPHHLLYNRNALFTGGIRPHHFCLPVLKREEHRKKLLEVATSGNPKFFAGTDSAPHPRHHKESQCGCAGIFNAFAALELYAEAFEQAGALDRLNYFVSEAGAQFYGLPLNGGTVVLRKEKNAVPQYFRFGQSEVVPLRAGEFLVWRMLDPDSEIKTTNKIV